MKGKIANIKSDSLFEMGDALRVQQHQLDSAESEKNEIGAETAHLEKINKEIEGLADEANMLFDEFLLMCDGKKTEGLDRITAGLLDDDCNCTDTSHDVRIHRSETSETHNDWNGYLECLEEYSNQHMLNLSKDAFNTLLSQQKFEEIKNEINDEFAKKTSIVNRVDISFLAIATALQTAKTLIFPAVAEKLEYGESFDPELRQKDNDKDIKSEEKGAKSAYQNKKIRQGNETGEWMEILHRSVPFDTTVGSPDIGVSMEGRYHRIHTLGHDPILGWIFGTANILTDTITLDTLATYKVLRKPRIKITPEIVTLPKLFSLTYEKAREDPLNLPAALVAEKIHLKSDEFTKCGLPVPILETFAPDFAGRLYKEQYDALCLGRDVKIVGTSAIVSILINMVIGLIHGLYYDRDKDGTREMFEVRTRKILLVSNTIASTSNILYSLFTENPKALDIGGLLVTLTRLFTDTRFILNVKREFIENRIYEKIEDELRLIDKNQNAITEFEYNHMIT